MAKRRKYEPSTILPESLRERVQIRPWTRDDVPFCRDTFRMSHAKSRMFGRCTDPNRIKHAATGRFYNMMQWADFYVCSHVEGEPSYGWIAVTPLQTNTIVWFVYVKETYRRMGLARHMINPHWRGRIYYPFDTRKAANFAERFQAKYDPFIYEELLYERPDKESLYLRKFAAGEHRREQAEGRPSETSEDIHG